MIIKSQPFTKEEIEQASEQFEFYIKTDIDIEKKVCAAGMERHFEGEQELLEQGSVQSDIWGGGIDLETMIIDFNSMINIRPHQNNRSNEILDPQIRDQYEQLTRWFFAELFKKEKR